MLRLVGSEAGNGSGGGLEAQTGVRELEWLTGEGTKMSGFEGLGLSDWVARFG